MQATRCAAVLGNNGLAEYSSRYKRLVLLILTLAYACNAMDRGIISTVGAFANYGFYGFAPLYFNRAFGLNYTMTGRIAALTGGVAVGVGIVAGGYLADRLGRRSAKAYAQELSEESAAVCRPASHAVRDFRRSMNHLIA